MAFKLYEYNDKTQISEHFNAQEFRCKCGVKHKIKIDDNLIPLLEKVRAKLNSKSCNIYSGYRCANHNKSVGGTGNSPHTEGYAVDCYFIGQDGKRIPSKEVCLALEDLGHKYGIGYRCGGGSNESGQTHIDVKPRKWYGDESKSMTSSCCNSYYEYFDEKKKKEPVEPDDKKYIVINTSSGVWCRKGIGFKHKKYKVIPNGTKCELLQKDCGSSNGYNWDKVKYDNTTVYIPNNWNKYL